MEEPRERVDCATCRHFYVTWEEEHPRGCHAFGFKTRHLPSAVVIRVSGRECELYEPRERPGDAPPRPPA